MQSLLFLLLCCLGIATCAFNGWEPVQKAPGDASVTLHFALTQKNIDVLEVFICLYLIFSFSSIRIFFFFFDFIGYFFILFLLIFVYFRALLWMCLI